LDTRTDVVLVGVYSGRDGIWGLIKNTSLPGLAWSKNKVLMVNVTT